MVFPECSISGFFPDAVAKATPAALAAAEADIAAAAKKANVYVIAGIREQIGSTDTFELSELHW